VVGQNLDRHPELKAKINEPIGPFDCTAIVNAVHLSVVKRSAEAEPGVEGEELPMTNIVEDLILNLLEWVGRDERTYQETIQTPAERLAFQQLHDDIVHSLFGADVVQRDDIGMGEGGHGPRLALEA
jgi:hypothetical protein